MYLLDGSLGWTFSRAVPLLDADGEISEWFGAASDMTGRHLAETRCAERARLLFLDALGETSRSVDADQILAITTRMLGEHLGVAVCAYADMAPTATASPSAATGPPRAARASSATITFPISAS